MKTIQAILVVLIVAAQGYAQSEFQIHDNGLIYDEHTMKRLGSIVDSLNLRFKTCEAKDYVSLPQGLAKYFSIDSDIKKARAALNNNISPEQFAKDFPEAFKGGDQWVLKSKYTDYRGKKVIDYQTFPLRDTDDVSIVLPDRPSNDVTSGWIYIEEDGELNGFYLQTLKTSSLPSGYARLVQYVDCMIDTTAQIYLAEETYNYTPLPATSKTRMFIDWANKFEGKPEPPTVDWDSPFGETQYAKYSRELEQWNNKRLAALDEKMKTAHYYKSLLMDAVTEAIENNYGSEELEFYAERYLSPSTALDLKRRRKPVGMCSMDQTPRLHAARICRLAAETAQWDIFLRAHLDIMNDNFSRASDGSYAWAGRGTYLKELEELQIEATDLLIGSSLRAENVNKNHYLGNIGRIGRALAETKDKDVLESRLLEMIADKELDLFNRLLMAYLFDNYNYYLEDEGRKRSNHDRFQKAVESMPQQIAATLTAKPRK